MKSPANPYIGPRAFLENERLYGRDRELADLLDLLIAERIVLLYSASGAGKSSLLQAGLIPAMKKRGYAVRNVIRVNGMPPEGSTGNRFVISTIASLQTSQQAAGAVAQTLSQFLDPNPNGELLIFDQFEEILNTDPVNLDAKRVFFEQLGDALRARGRWALFSMREDFLAGLDSYARYVPTRFSNTFRLNLLGLDASLQAIREPAASVGIKFLDDAVQQIADDLRQVNVAKPDGGVGLELGQFVEPVQLQVVCLRRWEDLPEGTTEIAKSAQPQVGATALADYYAKTISAISVQTAIPERELRDWFEDRLITKVRTRGQVLMGPADSEGLHNAAIKPLIDAHLVRSDQRLGSVWLELAHDRLIRPVLNNNDAWRKANLSPLQREAALWHDQGKPKDRLLDGDSLISAQVWARNNRMAPAEEEFLHASLDADQQRIAVEERVAAAEQRRLKDIRMARILKLGTIVMAMLLVAAAWEAYAARRSANAAEAAELVARKSVAEGDLEKIPALATGQQPAHALAYLARALRVLPDSPRALATAAGMLSRGALRIPLREVDHQSKVTRIVFSGDGARMLTMYDRSMARVWDVKTGKQVGHEFKGASGGALNRDGTLAVVFNPAVFITKASAKDAVDRTGHVFDVASGKELRDPASKTGLLNQPILQAEFAGEGRHIFTVSNNGVRLWDIDGGKIVKGAGIESDVQAATFTADHSAALISQSVTTALWRTSDPPGANVPRMAYAGIITSANLSPDGKLAAVVAGGRAYLWDPALGRRTELPQSDDALTAGFTADGQQLVVTGGATNANWMARWNAKTALPESTRWPTLAKIQYSSGQAAFAEVAAEAILFRDVRSLQPTAQIYTRELLDTWALSAKGNTLATSAGGRALVELWDATPATSPTKASDEEKSMVLREPVRMLDTGQIRTLAAGWSNKPPAEYTGALLSKDGSKVLLLKLGDSALDAPPEVRDSKTGALITQIPLGAAVDAFYAGALGDDGRSAGVASSDGKAGVYDLTNGKLIGQGIEGLPAVGAIQPTRDGSHYILGLADHTAVVQYTTAGAAVGDPIIHPGAVDRIVLSPDGRRAFTTSGEHMAAWDVYLGTGSVADSKALANLAEAAGGMRVAPWSPEPKLIPLAERLTMLGELAKQPGLSERVKAAIAGVVGEK